ncbi:MAG TPA: metalloregulator ArsR/SmtB family transcription factor [Planctomycetota bacterium]|nr:metalloregulator ArsR/SmtB family transcription factor [Planctomycetota bacterium]
MRSDPLDRAFVALADRTRRGVVELLRQKPHRAGELASRLDVSPPALTRHLRILRDSRLVDELVDDGDGRARVYRLRRETFTRLRTWVDEVEALWQDQLTAFAEHVGRSRKGPP